MDGDRAPLDRARWRSADRHDGMLVIDEAHATGVCGPTKAVGSDAHSRDAGTSFRCTPAARRSGVMGALILAPRLIRDFLVNRARAIHLCDCALAADRGERARGPAAGGRR